MKPPGPRTRITVRRAVQGDIAAITAIDCAAWKRHYVPYVPDELAESWLVRIPFIWHRGLSGARPDFRVHVAQDAAGEVLGFAASEKARLWSLQVQPECEGRGVATALFETVKPLCGPGLYLHALAADQRACGFWRRRGLRVIAELKDVYLDAEIPTLVYAW